jgi:bifunctional non-homologous end joining protein LigD
LKPGEFRPMLPVQEPLGEEEGFIHEIKWDGFRALAYLQGGKVLLESRGGHSLNRRFPQIASFLGQKEWQAVLDGEIVAFRPGGEADFSLLKSGSARMICYVAFDLLFLAGENLCPQPWQRRRALLEELVESAGPLLLSPLLPGSLGENLRRAREHGWEGIISKHRQSPYLPGERSPWWRKHKILRTLDAVVVGLRLRGRQVRSLALGLFCPDDRLVYLGSCGSGLGLREREFLEQASILLHTDRPPVDNPPPADGSWVWFQPHLVAEVEYLELTAQKRLRHPVFLRFRFDKRPQECQWTGDQL